MVLGTKDGVVQFSEWNDTALEYGGVKTSATPVSAGETKQFLFVVPIKVEGLYRVCLEVPCSPSETTKALVAAGVHQKDALALWSVETLVSVHRTSESTRTGES